MAIFYEKDHSQGATLDYGFNWSSKGWLQQDESITNSTWEATSGITLSQQQITGGITSTFVSGGVSGKEYDLVNTITTSMGRTDTRTMKLFCKNR